MKNQNPDMKLNKKFNPFLKLALAALLPLATSSCTVGPDYKRPDTGTPDTWRFSGTKVSEENIANKDWWTLFNDPELTKLIDVALKQNKDLKIATARVEQARANLANSKANQLPQVNAVGSYGGADQLNAIGNNGSGGVPFSYGFYKSYSAGGQISWEIDIFGKLRRATQVSREQYFAQEDFKRAVIISLVSEVAISYFTLRDLDNQYRIAKETVVSRSEAYRIAKARGDLGVVSDLDVKRFEAELQAVISQATALQREVGQQENNLQILLGQYPGKIPRGLPIDQQKLPAQVPAGLPSKLLDRRPDIMLAEHELAAATAFIGFNVANRFPQFDLTSLLGIASPDITRALSVGLGMSVQVLDFGRNKAQVEAARAQADAALYQYEKVILNAFNETSNLLLAVSTYRRQVEAVHIQVAALARAYQVASLQYDQGIVSYLDVIDAENALFNAQLQLSQLRSQYLGSVISLYKALGGGWNPSNPNQVPFSPASQPMNPVPPAQIGNASQKPAQHKTGSPTAKNAGANKNDKPTPPAIPVTKNTQKTEQKVKASEKPTETKTAPTPAPAKKQPAKASTSKSNSTTKSSSSTKSQNPPVNKKTPADDQNKTPSTPAKKPTPDTQDKPQISTQPDSANTTNTAPTKNGTAQ